MTTDSVESPDDAVTCKVSRSGVSTVYAVEKGSYSDHAYYCIAPTEEAAKAIANHFNRAERDPDDMTGGDYEVAAVPMYASPEDASGPLELTMSTTINLLTGAESRTFTHREQFWADDKRGLNVDPWWWWWKRHTYSQDMGSWYGVLTVRGSDHERVRKIYSDRRAQLLAEPAARAVDGQGHGK